MNLFTRYQRNDDNSEIKALFWDGNYEIYTHLLKKEPNFVGILDDSGKKGNDQVRLWNDEKKTWETCPIGSYIVKTENEIFTVKTKTEIILETKGLND